jgi:aspartyl-tRNA(Asn)/glutamyl-tRNA(Gln) amidotransferase subunit A
MGSLQESLIGYADWLGYGHGERAEAWLRRLEINQPELAYFREQPLPSCSAYYPAAVAVTPADGISDGRNTRGIASRADAAAAIVRARKHPDWHIFTWLADSAPAHDSGFLAGMPVAVKDLMSVAGAPLSGGSAAVERVRQQHDAEVVARLRRAGAAVIGITNLHELAYGITSDNPHFGRVMNPAAIDRIPGGSSGGSAAAVAAGIVPAAVGTDTAGSIRVPAACCGTVGFKPSYDAVPRTGVMDLAPSLDHVGPIGRTVDDCAALFAAMLDLPAIPAWRYADLSQRRIAKLTGYFEQPLDDAVRQALQQALDAFKQDGAACAAAEIKGMEAAPTIQFNTICAEATAIHAQRLRQHGDALGEDVRVRLEIGHFLPGHWYVKAQRMRRQLADSIDAVFQQADFLICPTMRAPAPPVGTSQVAIGGQSFPLHTAVTQLTLPFNLAGLPAISLPWDQTAGGVPIGLQIVGRRGSDWQVLAVAERLERQSPWRTQQLAAENKEDSHAGN